MSLIHLEKSVLTLHLREILEDGHGNHPLTWLGLSLLVFGPKLFPAAATLKQHRKLPSGFTPVSLSQWVAEARRRELESQMYAVLEARPTYSSGQTHAEN